MLPKLNQIASNPNENLYLIGHSAGVITILRYLENIDQAIKIGGAVFVAGFTDDLGFAELENFFYKPINFKKIKSKSKYFTAIHSDNDPYVPIKHGEIFKDKLGAQLIVKHNMQHFSGEVDNETSCMNLPDVAKCILEMK